MKYSNKKIVIIGGGFAGLTLAKQLNKASRPHAEIVLIDKANHHLFQPLLYQVASAALSPGNIATPIRQVLKDEENTTVLMAEVESINKKERYLILKQGQRVSFDILIVAAGARHSYFGNDHWETFAPGMKSLSDALSIRERMLTSYERAECSDSHSDAEKYLNFVIIGGGPTGVEMAGAIAEIAQKTMLKDFKRINTSKTKIYLIEGAPKILASFSDKLSKYAHEALESLTVNVITGKRVTNIDEHGVYFDDEFIASKNVIWAAGNEASPLLKTLDVPLDRQGRVLVNPDLSIPDFKNIFVIGDAANFKGKGDNALPGIAPVAIQQAKHLAKNINSGKHKPFKYFDKGMMATIGKRRAIISSGGIELSGGFAWLAWSLIHLMYIVVARSRLMVFLEWVNSYFTEQRGSRIIMSTVSTENAEDKKE